MSTGHSPGMQDLSFWADRYERFIRIMSPGATRPPAASISWRQRGAGVVPVAATLAPTYSALTAAVSEANPSFASANSIPVLSFV
jgi:hypothetical protein